MSILIAGGAKGSQVIRGQQLGQAIGATVQPRPGRYLGSADVIVLLKRAAQERGEQARKTGARLVWDVLDVWQQPEQNALPMAAHIARVRELQQQVGVSMLIAATQQMADDIGGVYLPHHSRPGLAPTAIRPVAKVVAYEGVPKYLGPWRERLEMACARLGLTFVVNPKSLSAADIIVAFRGGHWDGDVCRRWKSGVKYVNAIAAGRPVMTQPCAAFSEIRPFGTTVQAPDSLVDELAALMPAAARQQALEYSQTRAAEFSLETVARVYKAILTRDAAVAA